MKKVVIGLLVAVCLASGGCKLVMEATPFEAIQVEPSKVLVYVFRPESMISRGKQFEVDAPGGVRMGPLVNCGYVHGQFAPGDIELTLYEKTIPRGKLDTLTLEDTQAGQTYYIKAKPAVFGAYTLVVLDEATGKAEIGKTSYYDPN